MDIYTKLVAVRNTIASRGHCKGILEDNHGHVCVYGGLNVVVSGRATSGLEWDSMSEFAGALRFDDPMDLVTWNNELERTEAEVLNRLDEAIARTSPVTIPDTIPEEWVAEVVA